MFERITNTQFPDQLPGGEALEHDPLAVTKDRHPTLESIVGQTTLHECMDRPGSSLRLLSAAPFRQSTHSTSKQGPLRRFVRSHYPSTLEEHIEHEVASGTRGLSGADKVRNAWAIRTDIETRASRYKSSA